MFREEIRAVWRNYVPGDNCKQELIITDDILAVLDMLDKDLERHTTKTGNKLTAELKSEQTTTGFPIEHETLVPTRAIETGLNINNTLPSLQLQTAETTLAPVVVASDPTTHATDSDTEDIDYSDFVDKQFSYLITTVFRPQQQHQALNQVSIQLHRKRSTSRWKAVNSLLRLQARHLSPSLRNLHRLLAWYTITQNLQKKP